MKIVLTLQTIISLRVTLTYEWIVYLRVYFQIMRDLLSTYSAGSRV